jgi:AcrR family transcriptional regulator
MAYRTTPKMAERKDARRRTFLAAATRLFGRQGYHATTVPMIVAEAGASTGNFYFYFRNKEDIFAAALSNLGERITSAINAAIAKASPDPLAQMKAAVEGFVSFLAQNPGEARILIVESSGLSAQLEHVRRSVIASHSRGVENALRLQAAKLPPLDPGITARCWTGAVYEAVYSWLELPKQKRPSAKTLAEAVARFNLRGIGAPPDLM